MARPLKQGLDYFPLDCQLDDKFELIEAEFGLTGFGVVVKLLQRIYGQNGYYIEWTDEVALLFAKRLGVGRGVVSEIVKASIRRGLFNQEIFKEYGVLTSAGIQKRYLEITSRRKDSGIKKEYLLVDCTQNTSNTDNKGINVDNNSINADNNPQRKAKESKVNQTIVERSTGKTAGKNSKALTAPQKEQLIKEFGKELTDEYIKRTTAYHCCQYEVIRRWILEDREKQSIREKPTTSSQDKYSQLQFNRFMQREVTPEQMDELEKQLLRNSGFLD